MTPIKITKLLLLTVLAFFVINSNGIAQISDQEIEKIENALPVTTPAKVLKQRKLLVFSLSLGYQHDAIPYAAKMLELMGNKTGAFKTVHSNDMSVFKPEQLNTFDAVCFNNTTQLTFDDPILRKSLMAFVKGGKGIIGIHAATDNFYTWAEAAEMMGGVFDGHPWNSSGTWKVRIEDAASPLTAAFKGKDFSVSDEIYRTKQRSLRVNSRVLLALDMKDKANLSAKGVRNTDLDIPISWIRTLEKGRVFYCSFGHNKHIYWDRNILQHFLAGIQYALGDLKANATPVPFNIYQAVDIEDIKPLLRSISTYDYGQSRENLTKLTDLLRLTSASKKLSEEIEEEFDDFLESDASLAAKQYICERLSLIGTEESVGTLIDMLENPKTADMALYALERIPDDDVDEELSNILEETSGKTKIGIINTLGNRRNQGAISEIVPLINDPDPEIALATIHALGRIGGTDAAKALATARNQGKNKARITDAYLQCADRFAEQGEKVKAYKIYKEIFDPGESQQVQYAALRGMILTTEENASELILNLLKSDQKGMHASAIQLVRQIPSTEDVSSIARALPDMSETGQIQLLTSLAGRTEPQVINVMMDAAKSENENIQIAALKSLALCGDAKAIPLFAEVASTGINKIRLTAREGLYRINGPRVNETILNNMPDAVFEMKIEYIRAIAERQMIQGVPLLLSAIESTDEKVRLESIKAIREIATPPYMEETVARLAKPKSEQERKELEKAVIAIASQIPEGEPKASDVLAQLQKSKDIKTRISLLEVSGKIGDPAALDIIRSSIKDKNPEIQASAIRALSSWPDSTPLDDLLNVAKTTKNEKFRVLALRGYVKLISFESKKSGEEVFGMYQIAMKLANTTEEKRAVLSGLSTVNSMDALTFTAEYIDDKELQQEAGTTIIKIASALDIDQISKIKPLLYKSLANVKNETLKKQSREMINELERFEDHITLWQVAGPYDQKDVDIFDFAFPPESSDQGKVNWQQVPDSTDKNNYWHINLGEIYGSNGLVAYLKNKIWSETDQEVQLELGSNDAIRAWLNNKLIHSNNVDRGINPGDDKVKVKLNKGWNRLLIKIVNAGGAWGACARIRDLEGGQLEGLKVALDE
jgi:type 1 glutamine amidotransferase/HEAT repeat protein